MHGFDTQKTNGVEDQYKTNCSEIAIPPLNSPKALKTKFKVKGKLLHQKVLATIGLRAINSHFVEKQVSVMSILTDS